MMLEPGGIGILRYVLARRFLVRPATDRLKLPASKHRGACLLARNGPALAALGFGHPRGGSPFTFCSPHSSKFYSYRRR